MILGDCGKMVLYVLVRDGSCNFGVWICLVLEFWVLMSEF